MLWYKAWRESQARFMLGLLVVTGWYCTYVVIYKRMSPDNNDPQNYVHYIWTWIYGDRDPLCGAFMVLSLWLGAGGLLRERALGTAGYTLSLPTSRSHIVYVRAAVAILQVTALSLVPVFLNAFLPQFIGQAYPASQAIQFAVLWAIGGTLMVGLTLLASSIFDGEYTAPIVSLFVLLVYSHASTLAPLSYYPINIHAIMSGKGMPYFQDATALLIGPFPWTTCMAMAGVATGLVIAAAFISQREDF